MSWLGLGLGDLGSQIGQGHDIALDWKAREQDMALKAARQKIDNVMLPLQLQELQQRIKQMGSPQNELLATPGGGTAQVTRGPGGGPVIGQPKEIIAGKKASLKDQYEELSQSDKPEDQAKAQKILKSMQEESATTAKKTPVQQLQQEILDALSSNDFSTATKKMAQLKQLQDASKATGAPNKTSLIIRANAGDPEAQAALKKMQEMDMATAEARGIGFGKGRAAYQIGAYYDEAGTLVPMSNLDAINAVHAGKILTPAGRLSPKDAIAFQQFSNEAAPAIALAKASAKAYDNEGDKLIFANIMRGAGTPAYGQEKQWLDNVLKQALAGKLSPEGRSEAMAITRLNETVGRMRSILGLPSTDTAMQLTLSLVPGPMTPDSKYALGQIDMLEQMANLAVNIPGMRNVVPGAGGPGASLDQDLDRIFGPAPKKK